MTNQTFLTIVSALSAAIGTALAGITLIPGLDDTYKAIAVFLLSIAGTFFSALLKPPTGPMVAKNPRPRRAK